ncbi:MAG: hypothetical protein WCB49_12550 [Gammaproteobacteria bacterium]
MCAPALLLALFLAPAVHACSGKLDRMLRYSGGYKTAEVLGDPAVDAALKRLLGSELAHLQRNLGVSGPVDLIACDLVISGNAPHQGGEENAIIDISVYSGAVAAAILSQGKIAIYFNHGKSSPGHDYGEAVPLAIKDWLAVIYTKFYFRFNPPAKAQLLPPQGEPPSSH